MPKKEGIRSKSTLTDKPNITWEEFRSMPFASQQIYGCLGVEAYLCKNVDIGFDRETLFAEKFANDELELINKTQYDEGFDFLVKHRYLTPTDTGLYKVDVRCLYLVTAIMPYEEAKAGLIPGF